MTDVHWPASPDELERLQRDLALRSPSEWTPSAREPLTIAGVFVASATGVEGVGDAGDPLWAAAIAIEADPRRGVWEGPVVRGSAGGPYVAGMLALREGPLLERAVRTLTIEPDVLMVNGTGRDHPRRAGLAVHIGAVLDVPTVGVTVRPLLATAAEPGPERGDSTPLSLEGERVGFAVRTRRGARPVFAHAGWRTDPLVAREVVLLTAGRARTPEPIRLARRLTRIARARDERRAP